ncbi:quaternary amine ABC transporter ATP-binding protein [Spelaeicoccus albus]|uniref:Glycine betaine/proline transport system ATP-binding protein n=1 Tax=Spelaeicoccus albus TaxID=1280376 RepID=A0A7Z0A7Z4_9MICO|nr:glycine betaine/L-proline ABC transporter ATP-binding protein [Spelaeicoccus albus]NYI66047.1 glycine betaine/proline transport system ATP-binding protein [Spelaeicoccus albus]
MDKVRVQNLYKVFGKRESEAVRRLKNGETREDVKNLGTAAVIDASFNVKEGEIFVVMGLSGSGKSTLIRMLNGLWKPSAGDVFIGDTNINKIGAAKLRQVRATELAMVFQHFALLPHRTVRENAGFALEIQGIDSNERLERADHWLKQVGLDGWGDKLPGQLSGGMQQRVGLARALAAETDILLMDEAFSALDPLIRREMQDQLIDLQATLGKTIIFITHDLNEAMHIGARIAVMRDGQIVQIGSAEDVLTDPANDYVAKFVQDVDRARVLTASSIMEQPRATVPFSAGPRGALKVMQDTQISRVIVTRDRKVVGIVSDRAVVRAVREGKTDLEPLVHKDEMTLVSEDDPLTSLFAPSSSSAAPLGVVDANDRLVGIIPRIALLASMANIGPDTGEFPVIADNGELHAGVPVNGGVRSAGNTPDNGGPDDPGPGDTGPAHSAASYDPERSTDDDANEGVK